METQAFVEKTRRSKELQVNELVVELASTNITVVDPSSVLKGIQARIDELEAMLQRVESSLAASADPRETSSRIDALDNSLNLAQSRVASIRLEIERSMVRRDAASDTISKYNRRLEDSGFEPSRWTEYLSNSVTDADQKAGELADVVNLLGPIEKRIEDLKKVLETTERQRLGLSEDQKSAQFKLRGLEQRWTDVGLPLPVEPLVLLKAQQEILSAKELLNQLHARLRGLLDGYKRWLEDRDLIQANEEISSKMRQTSQASETEVEAFLVAKVTDARRKVERSTAVRELSEQFVHSLQIKADAYSEQVLKPLNTCIRQFSRALMTRADDSVTYRAEHYANRSELKPEINLRSVAGVGTSIEMNPNLYFSEGQLAALSISALFAASTCFRWSRWKALLLDDPLQHSDVIHASAFVEVIANLVKELGYQVVLSTHDETEFEYMANKFKSASIPLSLCELRVKGSIGPAGSYVQTTSEGTF